MLGVHRARFQATSSLDDEIGAGERHARVVEEPAHDRRRQIEGDVGDDAERLIRQRDAERVAADDLDIARRGEAAPQP